MDEPSINPDWIALDIRHPAESEVFCNKFSKIWTAIPYIDVRNRIKDVPTDKTMIIICDAGTRSYEIQCLFDHHDLSSLVLGGGFNCIRRIGAPWWPNN
jgi:rhodanese-related sulfurtransferase